MGLKSIKKKMSVLVKQFFPPTSKKKRLRFPQYETSLQSKTTIFPQYLSLKAEKSSYKTDLSLILPSCIAFLLDLLLP